MQNLFWRLKMIKEDPIAELEDEAYEDPMFYEDET